MSYFMFFVAKMFNLCYNALMKKLYYATFEKGLDEIVKKFINKQDKNSFIKKLYSDAVLFFADEKFKMGSSCFKTAYSVIDYTQKEGVGALNAEMKHLLEKKDLHIKFAKEIKSFKFLILKEKISLSKTPRSSKLRSSAFLFHIFI